MGNSLFCAKCGTLDSGSNQYCRSCGADLRAIRTAVDNPEIVLKSAYSAKQDIGRAFADRIRRADRKDLTKISEEILPEFEKFLESPEEKRLRRLRTGSVLSLLGLGAFVGFLLAAVFTGENGIGFLAACGIVVLFIGLAFFANGYYLSVPGGNRREETEEAETRQAPIGQDEADLLTPATARDEFSGSVTEGTTRNLEFQETGDGKHETEG